MKPVLQSTSLQAVRTVQQTAPAPLIPRPVSPAPLATIEAAMPDAYRVISFAIAHQPFALPLSTVSKVIQLPQKVNPFQSQDPFIIYQQEPLHLLNLYPLLAEVGMLNQPPPKRLTHCDTAILVWLNPHHRTLVLVDTIPQIVDLPTAAIHPLPSVLRTGFSSLAEYVAVLSPDSSLSSIFLLNLKKAQLAVQR